MWAIFHWKTSFGNNREELTIAEGAFVEHCGKFFNKMTLASLSLSQKMTNYSWCIIYHHSFKENKTQPNKKQQQASISQRLQAINSWSRATLEHTAIIFLLSPSKQFIFDQIQTPVCLAVYSHQAIHGELPAMFSSPLSASSTFGHLYRHASLWRWRVAFCCIFFHFFESPHLFWAPSWVFFQWLLLHANKKQRTEYNFHHSKWYCDTLSLSFFLLLKNGRVYLYFHFCLCLITCPTLKCAQTKLPNTYLFELHRIQQCHRNGHWHC